MPKQRAILIYNASKPFYNLAVEKLKVLHREDLILEDVDLFSPKEVDVAYFSSIFSWDVPDLCVKVNTIKAKEIKIGGPGVSFLVAYIQEKTGWEAHVGLWDKIEKIKVPNPKLTFTSRGCIRKCLFCLVPKIEKFEEYDDFAISNKIQDNNFLACSWEHRLRVYESLKQERNIDFNQGLDARLFTEEDLRCMLKIKMGCFRFAFDNLHQEGEVVSAINLLKKYGITNWRKIPVYVLCGFNDTPQEALYRIKKTIELRARPFVMSYKPLDWLQKKRYFADSEKGWSESLMMHIARFYNRVWLYTGGKGSILEYMRNEKVKDFFELNLN